MRVLCRSHFTFRGVRWRNIPKSEIDLHGGRRVVSRYIYVVDDDDQVRESLGFVLKMAGFQPVLFESGTKFLEEMDGLTPGCVLLDVRMPGVDGMYLLEHMIRARMPSPYVLMTGHGTEERRVGKECVSRGR